MTIVLWILGAVAAINVLVVLCAVIVGTRPETPRRPR